VLLFAAVCNGARAGIQAGGRSEGLSWSENIPTLYLAGSGDNPWALPQTHNEKPQGPAYQVNPHYVTPEDIESDSLDQTGNYSRKRNTRSATGKSGNLRRRQQSYPYGSYLAPNYPLPGYGGYYGGYYGNLPGMTGGLPGLGGYPLLYPYGGVDLGDPYNMLMQPYPADSEDDGD